MYQNFDKIEYLFCYNINKKRIPVKTFGIYKSINHRIHKSENFWKLLKTEPKKRSQQNKSA